MINSFVKKKERGMVGKSLIFTIILLSVGSLVACTEDEPKGDQAAGISVGQSRIEFEAAGGEAQLTITSENPWSLLSLPDWVDFSEASGLGDATITLTAGENMAEERRSDSINVVTADSKTSFFVTQAAGDPEPVWLVPPIEFAIDPDQTDMRDMSSVILSKDMGVGWNLGNSLEATGGETAWGNPTVSKRLIDSVKAAGFTSIRIPVAWSKFADYDTYTIKTEWIERVEEVVKYALDNEMYVVLNNHWDGGWMNDPVYEKEYEINTRLYAFWKQIATHFRDYDDHLLFAGTNEVLKEGNYNTPTKEYYTVQNGFNQTFVNAVRSTGGRNVYRHLVVQGFNTNVDHTFNFFTIPKDTVESRLFVEVHYYDPYDFTLNEGAGTTQWGKNATDPSKTDSWGQEDHVDSQFSKIRTKFVQKGYAMIVGEYGAISRSNSAEQGEYREYYIEYVTQSMIDRDLVPFYWDNGHFGNNGFAIFNRTTGAVVDRGILDAIMKTGK
jgi:endoglucanase